MLKSFSVKHFRNLTLDDMGFKRINIFVGPNQSGKSNFIHALNYCSDLITSETNKSSRHETAFYDVIARHGYGDVLNRSLSNPGEISMEWVISNRPEDLRYNLTFQVGSRDRFPKDFYITFEQLEYSKPALNQEKPFWFFKCHEHESGKGWFSFRTQNKPKSVPIDVQTNETVFAQIFKLVQKSNDFRETIFPVFMNVATHVKDFFSRFRNYSSTGFNLEQVRQPKDPDFQKYLLPDGSNFVNILHHLHEDHQFLDRYKVYLREIIDSLEDIRIETESDGKRQLYLKIEGKEFKLSEMSDGTIKAMLLALLLWTPDRMTILSLDEPELNLHPAWLHVIANWVQRSDSSDQIFISTHSPDFLDWFTDGYRSGEIALFVGDQHSEQTLELLEPQKLESFFQEGWKLGDLYRVGEPMLGGWPW